MRQKELDTAPSTEANLRVNAFRVWSMVQDWQQEEKSTSQYSRSQRMGTHSVQEQKASRKRQRILEVLIVLLILAAIAGLLGLFGFIIRPLNGLSTSNMAEVRMMSAAANAFGEHFKVAYIPSRIKLCKFICQYDMANPLDKDSLEYLNQVWPRLRWSQPGEQPDQVRYTRIDWDGIAGPGPAVLVLDKEDKPPQEPAPVILEGDQCLVFFLSGIPESAGVAGSRGFANDPYNPAANKVERITPFYEFKSWRLVKLHDNAFYSYLDAYGERPYAYFSAYGKRDGYNRYFPTLGNSDCARLGVWPYALSLGKSPQYANPDSFQILSAGADGTFGAGCVLPDGKVWSPTNVSGIDAPGRDDMSNFHSLLLGTPGE